MSRTGRCGRAAIATVTRPCAPVTLLLSPYKTTWMPDYTYCRILTACVTVSISGDDSDGHVDQQRPGTPSSPACVRSELR